MLPFGTPSTQSTLANQYTQMSRTSDSWLPSWLPNPMTWLNPFAPGRATAQTTQAAAQQYVEQTKQEAVDSFKPYLMAGVVIAAIVGASFAYKNYKSVRGNPRRRNRSR